MFINFQLMLITALANVIKCSIGQKGYLSSTLLSFPGVGTMWSLPALLNQKKRLNKRRKHLYHLHHLYLQLSPSLHLPLHLRPHFQLQPKSPPARKVQGNCWMMLYVSSSHPLAVCFYVQYQRGNIQNILSLLQVRHIADDPPCRCPNKFCVERQSQGRYRVGEKMLFIRVSST